MKICCQESGHFAFEMTHDVDSVTDNGKRSRPATFSTPSSDHVKQVAIVLRGDQP